MKFAVGLPNVGPFADAGLLLDLAIETEEAGWDGCFVWDHVLYRHGWAVVDAWTVLAAVAAATSRVQIGVVVAALPRQQPWEVAARVTAISALCGGRFVLGAGLGSMDDEYLAFGLPVALRARAERLEEALELIVGLQAGHALSHTGGHYHVQVPAVQGGGLVPTVPIWLAGRWPHRRPFRRAARWDGVVATHVDFGKGETMPPGVLRDVVAFTQAHRVGEGPFDVVVEGATPGLDVRAYETAGATWWIEAMGWWRGEMATNRARVLAGPPID